VYGLGGVVRFGTDAAPVSEADSEMLRSAFSRAGYNTVATQATTRAVFAVAADPSACATHGNIAPIGDETQLSAFIGRVDNTAALGAELSLHAEASSREIVAQAHRHWRENAPARLLGDFAYACWDERERVLYLTRDVNGWHMLYYLVRSDCIFFADSLPVLLALSPETRQLDPSALADVLIDGIPPADRTIWRNVQAVPSATSVRIAQGKAVAQRYWQLPQAELRYSRDEDYVDAARALLEEAIRCRLPADRRIGVALSGGLDSAGLAATAAAIAPEAELFGFTAIPFDGAPLPESPAHYNDERPYIQALQSRVPQLRALYASAAPEDGDSINDAIIRLAGMPLNNTLNAAWLSPAYASAAGNGVSTVLSGVFGNITLSYDGLPRLPALLDQGALIRFAFEFIALMRHDARNPWELARTIFASSHHFSRYRRMRRDPSLWPRQRLQRAQLSQGFVESSHWLRDQLDSDAPIPTAEQNQREVNIVRSQRQRHLHMPLQRFWKAQFVSPLTDRRLIEFCLSIPFDQYLRRGQTRSLARRVLSERLPAAILDNQRRGRQCPEAVCRLIAQAPRQLAVLEQYATSPLVRHCLDVPKIRAQLNQISSASIDDVGRALHLHRTLQHVRFLDYLAKLGASL